MQIYTDNVDQYVQSLAKALGRDPASLESWRCIHIQPSAAAVTSSPQARDEYIRFLSKLYGHSNVDLVFCADQDILIIGRATDIEAMATLEESITHDHLKDPPGKTHHYDLFYNWREIRKILLAKVTPDTAIPATDDKADFGQIDALNQVFDQSLKVRGARNPLHILFVEDDPMTLRLASSMFKEHYAVLTAKDAQEALINYLMHAPDIVFLDINLPDHNGFQVLKQILDKDPDAYVVMFSGNNELTNIMHALNAGASGFVAKPFTKEKMRHYIEDCAFASRKGN